MMAAGGEEKGGAEDFYAVLGLKKECSAADLRSAYKKLALRWHPDRCSASGDSNFVEEAKSKFQAIQEAYSVLSNTNKRFLYDVGIYDSDDDDDDNGMGDFLGEIVAMMNGAEPDGGGDETFEELQELFVQMFQADMVDAAAAAFGGPATAPHRLDHRAGGCSRPSSASISNRSPTAFSFCGGGGHKRDCSGVADVPVAGGGFCFGASGSEKNSSKGRRGGGGGKRRDGRKQKVSSRRDGSSGDAEISAA